MMFYANIFKGHDRIFSRQFLFKIALEWFVQFELGERR